MQKALYVDKRTRARFDNPMGTRGVPRSGRFIENSPKQWLQFLEWRRFRIPFIGTDCGPDRSQSATLATTTDELTRG